MTFRKEDGQTKGQTWAMISEALHLHSRQEIKRLIQSSSNPFNCSDHGPTFGTYGGNHAVRSTQASHSQIKFQGGRSPDLADVMSSLPNSSVHLPPLSAGSDGTGPTDHRPRSKLRARLSPRAKEALQLHLALIRLDRLLK